MAMSDDKKADILLQLFVENRKEAQWQKRLAVIIVVLLESLSLCLIGFQIAHGSVPRYLPLAAITVFGVLALGCLLETHVRHGNQTREYNRLVRALGLDQAGQYSAEAVMPEKKWGPLSFIKGRGLYMLTVFVLVLVSIWYIIELR